LKYDVDKSKIPDTKYSGIKTYPSFSFFQTDILLDEVGTSDMAALKEKTDRLSKRLKEEAAWTRDREPNYHGFRKNVRELLLQLVKASNPLVRSCQIGHTPLKTKFYQIVSITGNHNFLIAFFTIFFFGFGKVEMGRQIFVLLSSGVLVGNYFKDYLCLPRPSPPVERLSNMHNMEFGLPSTHSVTAFGIPFYLIYKLYGWDTTMIMVGIIYTFVVSYSRLYLGMHSLPDILAGILIGAALLYLWISVGFASLEEWVAHGSYVPITIVAIAAFLLFLHPEPYDYCPCFEDSVCFTASAAGIIAGGARYPYSNHSVDLRPQLVLFRYITGTMLIFMTRLLLKPLMYRILPWIYRTFSRIIPRRRFLQHFKPHQEVDVTMMNPFPSITQSKGFGQVRYDIDVPTKFVVYLAMGWVGSEGGPNLFWLLNLN